MLSSFSKLLLCLLASTASSSPLGQDTIVTPYLSINGYSASTWAANPAGGCTNFAQLLSVYPTADVYQWTGEQKIWAVQQIAISHNYMVIASPKAPSACFQIATITASNGKSVKAIVIDSDNVLTSNNQGDVSQAVIDQLWPEWTFATGPRMQASVTYSGNVTTLPCPNSLPSLAGGARSSLPATASLPTLKPTPRIGSLKVKQAPLQTN